MLNILKFQKALFFSVKGLFVFILFFVNVNFVVQAQLAKDTITICKGETADITATGIESATWSGTDDFTQISNSVIRVSPKVDATYSVVNKVKKQELLLNGNFEVPAHGKFAVVKDNTVPGWSTTATDKKIEFWPSGFSGVPAYDGKQFVELNANQGLAALYQDVVITPGSKLKWTFAHRGRSGVDIMKFEIGPPGGPYKEVGTYSDGPGKWAVYSGTYIVPANQAKTRFYFTSATGSSAGNLLDGIEFYTCEEQKDEVVVKVFDPACGCEASVDTDKDGICDQIDLDDDNDGILDVDESCPGVLINQAFAVNNGVTKTFNFPTAQKGFQFDVFKLDNSFNLTINGTKLVSGEIQCQSNALKDGHSKLVFASDNTGFGESGNSNIWQVQGTAESPTIRIVIGEGGNVTLQGKRKTTAALEPMKILNTHAQPTKITWNIEGTNKVVLSQLVTGATNMNGMGYGIQKCPQEKDTDKDGIPDYLDTDSDGDGCLDALEGGATFKTSDLSGKMLAGAVDANGVPVVANGGQAIGSSTNVTVQDVECVICTIPKMPTVNGVTGDTVLSFYMDLTKDFTKTITNFAANEKFRIHASGTWSAWSTNPANHVVDVAFRYKEKNASADITPVASGAFSFNGSGTHRPLPNTYNPEHKYWFFMESTGSDKMIGADIGANHNNSGGINLAFFNVPDTVIVCQSNTKTSLSKYVQGQNITWYTSITGGTGTSTPPEVDNNKAGFTEYWVTQTINGCESERTPVLYKVNSLPVINVNDEEICLGVQIVLKSSGGDKYVWKNVITGLSSTTIPNPTASPKTTTTYMLEVTDANTCVSEKDVKVTVNSLPVVNVSDETICLNY